MYQVDQQLIHTSKWISIYRGLLIFHFSHLEWHANEKLGLFDYTINRSLGPGPGTPLRLHQIIHLLAPGFSRAWFADSYLSFMLATLYHARCFRNNF